MEKITQEQPTDLKFKCSFFGAIRGRNKSGELIGLVSHVYAHRNDFSHKDFECSFYGSISKDEMKSKNVAFEDPEIWKLGDVDEIFNKRDEIIRQYQAENRDIHYFEVMETKGC